jgi:hypothetical protein
MLNFEHQASADIMFGGITIVCGIVGTLAGGFILDKIGSTIPNAFKVIKYYILPPSHKLRSACFQKSQHFKTLTNNSTKNIYF